MKIEEDLFSIDYIGEKLLILGSCILMRKIKKFIWYRVKIDGYLDSTFLIYPTYQISEILNIWKHLKRFFLKNRFYNKK